ncbi:MAG: phytochelatin synthase family protein [Cyanobium sp.]
MAPRPSPRRWSTVASRDPAGHRRDPQRIRPQQILLQQTGLQLSDPQPIALRRSVTQRWLRRLASAVVLPASLWCLAAGSLASGVTPGAGSLTPLAGPAGLALLSSSQQRADYGPLADTFLTQANLAYCGVASSVMALNSLAVPAPPADGYGRYRFWTQENLFGAKATRSLLPPEQVARRGMTLQQLRGLLASTGAQASTIHGSDLDLAALRRLVVTNLANAEDRLLVNYRRSAIGQEGGGHISPLAAYHAPSDRVLILDVARYRYPSVWVPLNVLWQAMRTTDPDSGLSRGLVIVRRPRPAMGEPTP